ncbi:ribosomal protein S5 domain 2-type protein [Coniochaeta sp. 2T2.1]|nr:ribosomal protein S5 domain 2-type protein [Coniochaeta sp. 2T2.1]
MSLSPDLQDEVEALNSIYGASTLHPCPDDPTIFILALPDETAASLRLQFSPGYPDEPPSVLGVHSAGEHGKRGAAARDLELFREAVAAVYEPGQVCLFDAVEKLKELLSESSGAEDEGTTSSASHGVAQQHHEETGADDHGDAKGTLPAGELDVPEPEWVISNPLVEMKSTFVARCAAVTSPDQAFGNVQHLLATDKKVRTATHNITAWRIRGPNGTSFQDCDDDGETAAGGRLLHLMQLMDIWDAMVVVTRWYGGQKLGPRRFAVINTVARDAFVKAGLVAETPATKKKGQGKT